MNSPKKKSDTTKRQLSTRFLDHVWGFASDIPAALKKPFTKKKLSTAITAAVENILAVSKHAHTLSDMLPNLALAQVRFIGPHDFIYPGEVRVNNDGIPYPEREDHGVSIISKEGDSMLTIWLSDNTALLSAIEAKTLSGRIEFAFNRLVKEIEVTPTSSESHDRGLAPQEDVLKRILSVIMRIKSTTAIDKLLTAPEAEPLRLQLLKDKPFKFTPGTQIKFKRDGNDYEVNITPENGGDALITHQAIENAGNGR